MSYCRWNEGDVYAYASTTGGYVTHVATRKPVSVPRDADARILVDAAYERIDLPFAGRSFHDEALEDLEARLHLLRKIGYVVPDRAFNLIDEERREARGL
jgi:hypothetical protein